MSALGLFGNILKSQVRALARPFKLTLILNYSCNCRCSMCSIWARDSRGEMTLDEIRRFFQNEPGWSWVNLSGGEILMKQDAARIVETAVTTCPGLYLLDFPTTGFDPDRLVGLVESALRSRVRRVAVTISLDGPREVHDGIRRAPGLFDKAVESMRRLRAIGDRRLITVFGFTVTPENAHLVRATVEDLTQRIDGLDPRDVHVNAFHRSEHYYANSETMCPSKEATLEALLTIRRLQGRPRRQSEWLEGAFQEDLVAFIETGELPYPCRSLRTSVFVDPFWNVYPCITFSRKLGNLRENGFDLPAILETPIAASTRAEIDRGECPRCFTACEAYQTMLSHGLRLMKRHGAAFVGAALRGWTRDEGRVTTAPGRHPAPGTSSTET